jgi:hypothetical protein
MAFKHGKQTKILVDQYDFSSYLNNTDMSWEIDTPETTTFGDNDRTYIAGLRNSTMSFAGFWDATVDGYVTDDITTPIVNLISYAPEGLSTGSVVYSLQARYTSWAVGSPVDGVATVSLDVQGTDRMSRGISLHNLTAETETTNATEVDNGSSSASGGVGYLHVISNTLSTTDASEALDISIYDASTTTFTALIDFTTLTTEAVASERKTVAGTILNNVRAEWTAVGTGAFTFVVGFQRL